MEGRLHTRNKRLRLRNKRLRLRNKRLRLRNKRLRLRYKRLRLQNKRLRLRNNRETGFMREAEMYLRIYLAGNFGQCERVILVVYTRSIYNKSDWRLLYTNVTGVCCTQT